ncbi:hypothetical protein KM043_013351, partial [Ampulex compressa]
PERCPFGLAEAPVICEDTNPAETCQGSQSSAILEKPPSWRLVPIELLPSLPPSNIPVSDPRYLGYRHLRERLLHDFYGANTPQVVPIIILDD